MNEDYRRGRCKAWGEKDDCLRCYLRHMSCDLRGGRLRFRVAIQGSQTVPLV